MFYLPSLTFTVSALDQKKKGVGYKCNFGRKNVFHFQMEFCNLHLLFFSAPLCCFYQVFCNLLKSSKFGFLIWVIRLRE